MRVIVSGATGFLGGHLVHRLLADGMWVTAIGRNRTTGAALNAAGATFVPMDLATDTASLAPADAFVHCAALSSNWGRRADFVAANVTATANALRLARAAGVRRFVHISSPSVCFRFADQLALREDQPLPPPVNAYAATKAHSETLVRAATDLAPIILRPRGIYGRGDTALLPRLVRAAKAGPLPLLRDGRAVTDLTHVDDVVAAIRAALDAPTGNRTLNISGGESLPIRHIVDAACAHAGITPRWRPLPVGLAIAGARLAEATCSLLPGRPEPVVTAYSLGVLAYSQTLDISAARDLLRWQPTIRFADGLARL